MKITELRRERGGPVTAPTTTVPRMDPLDRDRMRAAAAVARYALPAGGVLPRAFGELVARELDWHADTGWRLVDGGQAWRLVEAVEEMAAVPGSQTPQTAAGQCETRTARSAASVALRGQRGPSVDEGRAAERVSDGPKPRVRPITPPTARSAASGPQAGGYGPTASEVHR